MGRSRAATSAGRSRSASRSKAPAKPRSKTAKQKTPAKRVAVSKSAKRAPRAAPRKKPSAPKPKLLASLRRSSKAPKAPKASKVRKASRRSRAPMSWRYRLAIAGLLAAALTAGYFSWLRDSPLVAVDDVEVVGVTGGERERIVSELTRAGKSMTTLNLDETSVERAAAPFPTVESVDLDPNFPHGLRIEVSETPPVSLVSAGDREVPLAADGSLLEGASVPDEALPVIEVDQIPTGGELGGEPLEQALIAGAAPEPLRPLIENVDHDEDLGVLIRLRGDIPVRFGTGARAPEKWAAAAAVLADPKLDALTYIDVRVPERPAAGGATIAGVPADPAA